MTLQEALNDAVLKLESNNIDNSSYDAFAILEYVTRITKKDFLLRRNDMINDEESQRYQALIDRRIAREPLQHITNCQNFYGYDFYVDANVLVPRQDTETLVEQVLKLVNSHPSDDSNCRSEDVTILDMCTGSGCIAIVTYLELLKQGVRPKITATDISKEALQVALRNADSLIGDADYFGNDNAFRLVQSDLFDSLNRDDTYDIIVSNPPYIPTKEIEDLEDEVRLHDPFVALDGDEDGLKFYRNIIDNSPKYLRGGGYLCFEIGYNQGPDVSSLMSKRGFTDVNMYKDLAGLDRVIIGRIATNSEE